MSQLSKGMIANHLQKRPLLVAINVVAGLSIFFFGKLLIGFPFVSTLEHTDSIQVTIKA